MTDAEQQTGAPDSPSRRHLGFLLLGIIFITLNLRGAVTTVGPVLENIQADLGLSSGLAGLLATLPIFAFAFISPFAATVARRIGIERALMLSLLLLLAGLLLRHAPTVGLLFFGTGLIGTGIAIANVLVPGLIRRDYPDRLARVTAIFTMTMVTFGGIGSGIAVPLAEWGGWRMSLLAWALPAVLAIFVWLPQVTRKTEPVQPGGVRFGALLRSPLAWHVSLFMGFQSTAFYVMISWLPSILAEEGISAVTSGWILFVYQIFVLGSVMAVPMLVSRFRDQKLIGAACGGLNVIGYAGLLLAPAQAMPWMIIMGLGCGGSLVLALTFFGLRAGTTQQTVALSGMAQAIGYLMAAIMPVALGITHDITHDWSLSLFIMVVLCVIQVVTGYLAGRPLTVGE